MKKLIRSYVRNSFYFAKMVKILSLLPIPLSFRKRFISVYLQSEALRPGIEETIKKYISITPCLSIKKEVVLSKSAIIKPYSASEKGLILVGFEHELDNLLFNAATIDVLDKYEILFMPTWQPFYSESLLRALKKAAESLVLLPSSESCYYKALALSGVFRTMPFHASSWIFSDLYSESKVKDIDLLMVANFSRYKRHFLLFEALRHLPHNLKVVFVGRPLAGRSAKDIIAEAKAYGVEERFEIIESASNEAVVDYLSRAKLVLGLSGREGSYVSLAEALFAGAAVGVYADAHIGTKSYINPKTGFLFQPDIPLYKQIQQSLDIVETLRPREWAKNNISAEINFARLNSLLMHDAKRRGLSWNTDCQAFYVQSFQIEPLADTWCKGIEDELLRYEGLGLKFRTQLLKVNVQKN